MSKAFKAKRISRTSTITLAGSLAEVFPLFGPLREKEWAFGWNPQVIYPPDARLEEGMVFKTPAHLGHGEPDYIWTLSRYQPGQAIIAYTIFTPERLWTIAIQCAAANDDLSTAATITYTFTGLTSLGNALNEQALQHLYADDLRDWEEAINHYLHTGTILKP